MSDTHDKQDSKTIPEQLQQIAREQEGGAERVISQIEVVENSFEEIQSLTRTCQELLTRVPPSEETEALVAKLEEIAFHADNGTYNVQGVYDLFQYQDVVRQKLEKVGYKLIQVAEYVLSNLAPCEEQPSQPIGGRDILERESQMADTAKVDADAVIAEFFAKSRQKKTP